MLARSPLEVLLGLSVGESVEEISELALKSESFEAASGLAVEIAAG